jgi:hypothetical protein
VIKAKPTEEYKCVMRLFIQTIWMRMVYKSLWHRCRALSIAFARSKKRNDSTQGKAALALPAKRSAPRVAEALEFQGGPIPQPLHLGPPQNA